MAEPPDRPALPGALQLSIDDSVANGMYSNFQVVGSSETEFILDSRSCSPAPRAMAAPARRRARSAPA